MLIRFYRAGVASKGNYEMQDENSPDAFARAMEERRRDPSKVHKPKGEPLGRTAGVIALAASAFFFYFGTYSPWVDALEHRSILLLSKGNVIVPGALLAGLFLLLFGKEGHAWLEKWLGKHPRLALVGLIAVVALSVGYAIAVDQYFQSLGYR